MKKIFYLIVSLLFITVACSEDKMDEINEDLNNAQEMATKNLIPDLLLKSGFETTGTDIAWYTTVYIEHNAGTWNQSYQADQRNGQESASLFNNNWNSIYDVMNIAKTIINATDPETGAEPDNYWTRGLGQLFMAYNLAVATDMWGDIPYEEAFQGKENLNPAYQEDTEIYPIIFNLLDDAIENLNKAERTFPEKDFLYDGDTDLWVKTAYALKARFNLRLTNLDEATRAQAALDAVANSYESQAEQLTMGGFILDLPNANPWGEFWYLRDHLSVSTTIFDIMDTRNDPRMGTYFSSTDRADVAPIGEADQVQGAYAQSNLTSGWGAFTADILMFSYHELKFIEAEAKFRLGDATWQATLEEAIQASFDQYGIPAATTYFNNEVLPRLTAGNELNEIITQKYIAFYDREAIEAYNDYRRTGIPEMQNPNNAITGFVNRFPYALSEVSSNSQNVPDISVYEDKVFWAK